MKLVPKFRRIIVLPEAEVEKTEGGILIPEAAREPQIIGTVVAVSTDVEEIKVGDKILYPKNCGTPVFENGKTYLVMREFDAYCVIGSKSEPIAYVSNSTANVFDS